MMKQPLFIKNTPIDEKRIDFIEQIVSRLTRRAKTTATAIVTPYPISNAVFGDDVRGAILRYMFPCEGVITKGLICLGSKPKNAIQVSLGTSDDIHGVSASYNITGKHLLLNPDIDVDSGDKLTVSVEPLSDEDKIEEVWASFLWVPSVKNVQIKKQLIDSLEHDLLEE